MCRQGLPHNDSNACYAKANFMAAVSCDLVFVLFFYLKNIFLWNEHAFKVIVNSSNRFINYIDF